MSAGRRSGAFHPLDRSHSNRCRAPGIHSSPDLSGSQHGAQNGEQTSLGDHVPRQFSVRADRWEWPFTSSPIPRSADSHHFSLVVSGRRPVCQAAPSLILAGVAWPRSDCNAGSFNGSTARANTRVTLPSAIQRASRPINGSSLPIRVLCRTVFEQCHVTHDLDD